MVTTVITGATSGIGLQISKQLASYGHNLILISRSYEKLEILRSDLLTNHNINIQIYSADLSLFSANLEIVSNIIHSFDKVDILINNVGGIFMDRMLTNENIEMTFALNHMSYYILSTRLIKYFKCMRIINVSSAAHRNIKLNESDYQNNYNYNGWFAYKRSKLANIYLTYEMHRKYADTGHIINCLHPGVVNTNFANNNNIFYKTAACIIKYFGISPKEGAKTAVYLATQKDIKDISGLYFDKCYPKKTSKVSYDLTAADKLWNYSESLLS